MRIPRHLVLLTLLSACTIEVRETSVWNRRGHWGVQDRTGAEVVVLESPADVDATTVQLSVRGRGGAVVIELTDPDARVRYRETLRGGDRESELRFEPMPGEWRCRFEFEGFTGDYQVHLGAHSEPGLRVETTITEIEVR